MLRYWSTLFNVPRSWMSFFSSTVTSLSMSVLKKLPLFKQNASHHTKARVKNKPEEKHGEQSAYAGLAKNFKNQMGMEIKTKRASHTPRVSSFADVV